MEEAGLEGSGDDPGYSLIRRSAPTYPKSPCMYAPAFRALPLFLKHSLILCNRLTAVTMDARIDRDAALQQLKSQSRIPQQTWYEW